MLEILQSTAINFTDYVTNICCVFSGCIDTPLSMPECGDMKNHANTNHKIYEKTSSFNHYFKMY